MKGLRKMFSTGLFMWRGWGMTGLLRGSMQDSLLVVAQWASHGRKRWIDTVKDCFLHHITKSNLTLQYIYRQKVKAILK